ncbi:p-hydroxybenzoic acid efflux pump subunit AaeB [Paraburkholderia hiiakae]|uniref:p-hydroxybenzoic acid efflux pump subunit AaeB n=2 Tax=Paraburkholderia hiiakae TaxID=1081782 RepID=A0ABN7HS56_9BURK|nr:p-hydroxybenzoic acid efflux pump subunit AaeB [Paraburkholderia hiiakae]
MSTIWQGLRKEFADVYGDELPRVLHAFKAALAVVVSMLICMRLELRSPGTSMVSAVIVMFHQQSGMVIARAFYRTLGICCGCLAGLILISLFAQEPELFLAGLSLWVGLFVAGSSYYKNYQSYGFVLSGYAACITTVPEWSAPYDVTNNIIYTISEVLIGVASGSLVSALIFPQRVVPALTKWRANALTLVLTSLSGAARGEATYETAQTYLKLIRESVSMEGLRTAAVFEEPEMRLRNDGLMELDQTFLGVVTRIFSLYRARRITANASVKLRATAEEIFRRVANLTAQESAVCLETGNGMERMIGRLRDLEASLLLYLDRQTSGNQDESESDYQPVAMIAAEAFSAIVALRLFCGTCKMLLDPPRIRLTQPVAEAVAFLRSVPIHTSAVTAAIAGLRAATAVGVVGIAWVLSGWDDGYSAVVAAGITSGFFSLSPTPATASWQVFVGCLIAWIVGFMVNFFLMPVLGSVTLFALCLGVLLFMGSYVNTFPRVAVFGAGFNIYFCYVLTPTNPAVYNPSFLLDRGLGLLIGIGVSAAAFSLVISREGQWMAGRYAERIRSIVQRAAHESVDSNDTVQVGIAMRDLIVHISTVPHVTPDQLESATSWAFDQLWVVNTLMQVRSLEFTQSTALPEGWSEAQGEWLSAMERLAQHANADSVEAALVAIGRALSVLSGPPGDPASETCRAILKMRARLYSTWAALTDQLPRLDAVKTD